MAAPNILYINSHDTGRYVEPYGHAVPTPNIARFAAEGVLFRQAFCAGPTCSPSRAALVTGSYPHENGMLGLAHRGFRLNDYGQHIVGVLRPAGYRSTLCGFQHVATDPGLIGYDEVLSTDDEGGQDVVGDAQRFLSARPRGPFYLEIGFFQTHRDFPEPTPADDPRYTRPPEGLPDSRETRHDMACFNASARILDDKVGAVLGALDASRLADNTLVILTTDHGIAFPRMKCTLTEGGTGVMLMMRGPGGFAGGKVVDSMVSQVDIMPTLCEAAGLPAPAWARGRSIGPLVRGEACVAREEVFSEVNYHAAYEPQRSVRTRGWSYIRRFGDRRRVVLPNCDDGPSKDLLMRHGWGRHEHPTEALYNLIFDPCEQNNLAADPSAAQALADMRARLDRWMHETNDPLLSGPVPAPPGARVNDPDGISPTEKPRTMP